MFEDETTFIANHNEYMKQELCNLYKSNKFSDCIFLIGNEKIPAHKLILALNSPVFERMLYGPLSSSEIEIVDIEIQEFKQMLEYVYLHKVKIESIPNAWKLLYVSRKYFLNELHQLCTNYITNNLNISNLLLSYEYADLFNLVPVITKCKNDIVNFPTEVLSSSYHLQPCTFAKVLLFIYPFISVGQIQEFINTWTTEECEIHNVKITEYNKVKVLHEAGISKFMLINILQNCLNEKDEINSTLQIHYLKLRAEYKVDRVIPFKYNCSFITEVKTNQNVLVSGVALQIGEAHPPCSLKCSVIVTVLKRDDKLYQISNVGSNCYVKFHNSVILSPNETYKFIISYILDSDVYCGVTSYYMDAYHRNKKNGTVFEFVDDPKGSVLKGLSYYLF